MIRDITLGQFFPGDSVIHKMDPRMKIMLCVAYIALLFTADGPFSYAFVAAVLIFIVGISGINPRMIWRGVRPLLFFILITGIFNLLYTPGETVFKFWIMRVTREGIENAVYMAIRLVFLVAGTSLLTYTTSPIHLTDGIEGLLNPLKRVRVPVHELSMMMTIALRFIPTLIEETDKIICAQKGRGADFESGSVFRRVRALIPVLVPLFVSAFRRADELATAMECRCYRGGEGRTKLKRFKMSARDFIAAGFMAAALASVIIINIAPLPRLF